MRLRTKYAKPKCCKALSEILNSRISIGEIDLYLLYYTLKLRFSSSVIYEQLKSSSLSNSNAFIVQELSLQ